MCYSGLCIWEAFTGDCGYPRYNRDFLKVFPKPLCYTGKDGEESIYVKKVEIAFDCYNQITELKSDQITEKKNAIKKAERKLKLLKIFME
jgi:hypothetical protein